MTTACNQRSEELWKKNGVCCNWHSQCVSGLTSITVLAENSYKQMSARRYTSYCVSCFDGGSVWQARVYRWTNDAGLACVETHSGVFCATIMSDLDTAQHCMHSCPYTIDAQYRKCKCMGISELLTKLAN